METKEYFGVYANSDLTEGRGYINLIYVCECESTALRLAKGRDVMGSDAMVKPVELIYHGGTLYRPISAGDIQRPTADDVHKENILAKQRETKQKKQKLLQKLVEDGYSKEDIEILTQ